MKYKGQDIKWGSTEDKYLGFNIRKGYDSTGNEWGYFATKKGKVIPFGTQKWEGCRNTLRDELNVES